MGKIMIGLEGCGSVSRSYCPTLAPSPTRKAPGDAVSGWHNAVIPFDFEGECASIQALPDHAAPAGAWQ
ncbi:MAG: hypothetical protein ABGY41_20020 [Candidatus Poribacteria bacterium]